MKFLKSAGRVRTRIILAGLVLPAGLLLLLAGNSLRYLHSAMPVSGEEELIDVAAGSSLARITAELQAAGLIVRPRTFSWFARGQGVANALRAGEYALRPGITPAQLLKDMVAGRTVQYRVTLVEGWTFQQALAAIWQSEKIDRRLQNYDQEQITGLLDMEPANPEGMLFPDTYFYTRGTSDIDLMRRAHARLKEVLEQEWQNRLGALPYATPYQALIMASIVEKESAVGSERGQIAGVFVRRLEQGMRLQSDPTVIYGMGASYDGDIRRSDLNTETSYNTYRINGLPPTPIALAGLQSIRASLNPVESDYLYFVSRGDGSHQFSATLEQHNQAVQQYQRQPAN